LPKGSHHAKKIFIFTSRVWCLWDLTQTTEKQFLHSRNHEAVPFRMIIPNSWNILQL
jgi:hypothetical protein